MVYRYTFDKMGCVSIGFTVERTGAIYGDDVQMVRNRSRYSDT